MKLVFLFLFLTVFVNAQVKLSHGVYKKLTKVQELTEQKKYEEALNIIDSSLKKDILKGDRGYLLQSKGYIYITLTKYKKAIASFKEMNSLNVMGEENYLSSLYNIAQLQMSLKNYKGALVNLQEWTKRAKEQKAEAYLMMGQCYTLMSKIKPAIENINKAITVRKKGKKDVPISWYELLFSNYYQVEDYKNAINTLNILVKLKPEKKDFWIYLAQIYYLQGEHKKGLSIYEQAYNLDLLDGKDTLTFASYLLQNSLYYKGAEILESHIKKGLLKEDKKSLELLFKGYLSAKEFSKSLKVLDRLIKKSKEPEYYLQKARIYNMIHESTLAIKMYEKALKQKSLKGYFKANLELGYLYYDKGFMEKSKECFVIAKKNTDTKKQASKFLSRIE